jgi:hypothetical protein
MSSSYPVSRPYEGAALFPPLLVLMWLMLLKLVPRT